MGPLDRISQALGLSGNTPQAEGSEDQLKSEAQIVSFVETKIEDCRKTSNRTAMESIWLTNSAWLLGYTNVYWDSNSRVFRSSNVDIPANRRQRLQTNRILPTIQNRTARLTKKPPMYEVRPNSMDIEDKDACRLGKMVIDSVWDMQKINRKRIDLVDWLQRCGHSYMKVTWDDELGERIVDPMTGESQYTGDIRVEVVPAFEIYPDPAAKNMEELTWLVQTKIRPLAYFKDHYENGHLVKEESVTIQGLQYLNRINTINSRSDGDGNSNNIKNSAVEKAYYERPSKKYPNGRMIITAGGKLMEDKELPCGLIPFAKFDDFIVGGRFYGEALVTHLRPIQDQLNRIINQRNDWIKKLIAGKYAVPRGAGLHQEAMNDMSGEIVEYDPVPNAANAGMPLPITVPQMPQYVYTEEDRLTNAFFDIAGINEVSRGQLPAAGLPAKGMELLLEADETRIGLTTNAHEHSWAYIGRLILKFAQKYYNEPRLLKVSNSNGYMVKHFLGADLKDNHDVVVIPGSTIPGSMVVKRNDILNAFNQGLLGDPSDPAVREKVLGMLEFGNIAEAWKDRALDEQQVKKAIELIESGVQPQLSEFDNHTYWLQEMNRYRKSDKYEKLGPYQRMVFDQTMELCIQLMMPEQVMNPLPGPEQMMMEQDAAANIDQGGSELPPPEAGVA